MSEYIVKLDGPYAAGYHVGEEIVRCRDCINYSGEDDEIYPKWCMQMNITEVESNGFCAWAERRDA